MGGLFGQQQKSTSTVDKMAAGIRFQTSAFGLAWTLLFGRNRTTGNLVDYQDFLAIPHTENQSQAQGGKGGGAPTSTHTSFTYQVALALGLCAGPLAEDAIKTIWVGKEKKYGTNNAIGSSQPRPDTGWAVIGSPAVPSPSPSIFELMAGAPPPEPGPSMVANHPTRAIGYHGLACSVAPQFDLGDNENLANIGIELVGLLPYGQPQDVVDYQVALPSDAEATQAIVVPDNPGPYVVTVTYGPQWTRDISVIDNYTDLNNPATFTKATGAPAQFEYSVTDIGQYTFNSADKLKMLDVTYGRQANSMTLTVPEYLHFVSDEGVKDPLDVPLGKVAASPAVDQYSEDSLGGYTFSRFNSGDLVKLSYVFNDQLGAVADDVLKYTWNNPLCGLGQSLAKLEDWSDYRNSVLANNWLLSPFLTAQESLKDFWERILGMANSYPVWREGKIGTIPRGDIQMVGNGAIWMPDMASLFSFSPLHFLTEGSSLPIRWVSGTPQDAYNHVQVEFLNKDNEYNTEPAEYKDEADIEDNGLKTDETVYKCHEITFKEFAQQVAQNKVNDYLFQADQFEFDLPWHFGRYWPGDIVDLTDLGLSLDSQLVRTIKRVEAQDGCYTFTVQALDIGSGTPGVQEVPQGQGYAPDLDVDPGDVNAPAIFVPPANLIDTEMEVWVAASGGVNWGGCNLWISESGANYKYAGQIIGGARHGVLSASLLSSAISPDTVNTLSIDLTTSRGPLLSGTQADAEALNTLCRVEGGGSVEYLAYKTSTLTSQYNYGLTWLVRGIYGSGMLLRPSGSTFVRLDGAVFKYLCKRADIGKTVDIKFQPFNIYMRKLQALADIDPYVFTITNPGDGALAPIVNLTAINNAVTPDTKVDVAFDSCPFYNTAGSRYGSGALGFTIDGGVNGLNGMDTGSLAASTWYYLWAIANPVQGLVGGLLSLSSTTPTLPAGYTYKRLLGAVRTDGSGHFLLSNQVDDETWYESSQALSSGTTAQAWTVQDASALVPPISTRAMVPFYLDTSVACDFGARKNGSSGNGPISGTAEPGIVTGEEWVDLDAAQKLQLLISEAVNEWSLKVRGFKLSL